MFPVFPNRVKYLAGILLLAAVYFAAGKLGLRLAFENLSATLVWPPTGIALAAAMIVGKKFGRAFFWALFW